MLYPNELAYDVFKFSNAIAHMSKGISAGRQEHLPDAVGFNAKDNALARAAYKMFLESSRRGVNLGEIILAQIKEYYDAREIDNIGRDGGSSPETGVQGS